MAPGVGPTSVAESRAGPLTDQNLPGLRMGQRAGGRAARRRARWWGQAGSSCTSAIHVVGAIGRVGFGRRRLRAPHDRGAHGEALRVGWVSAGRGSAPASTPAPRPSSASREAQAERPVQGHPCPPGELHRTRDFSGSPPRCVTYLHATPGMSGHRPSCVRIEHTTPRKRRDPWRCVQGGLRLGRKAAAPERGLRPQPSAGLQAAAPERCLRPLPSADPPAGAADAADQRRRIRPPATTSRAQASYWARTFARSASRSSVTRRFISASSCALASTSVGISAVVSIASSACPPAAFVARFKATTAWT